MATQQPLTPVTPAMPVVDTKGNARHRTSDEPYVTALLDYLGEDVLLDSGDIVRAIIHDVFTTTANQFQNITIETIFAKAPTRNLEKVKPGDSCWYDGERQYIATKQRISKGWSIFTLNPQ